MLDIRNGLAYRSPMNGTRIRVNPAIDNGLFERRRRVEGLFVPSQPDELAHIICHSVFDKEGNFSRYYTSRCQKLFEQVQADPQLNKVFKDVLKLIFFNADRIVYSSVKNEELDQLLDKLYSFSDY